MADDPLAQIAQLPGDLANLAAQVVTGARQMQMASVDRWFGTRGIREPLGESVAMGAARLKWRIVFERRRGSTLFGFRVREGRWSPLEALVEAEVRPVKEPAVTVLPPVSIAFPDYWLGTPSAAELAQYAPAGSGSDDTVLIETGEGVLGVRLDKRLERSRIRFQGMEWPRPNGRVLPVSALLSGIEAMLGWRDRGMPTGGDTVAAGDSSQSPVAEVIRALAACYEQSQMRLAATASVAFRFPPWDVSGFRTQVTLRLREDGELAEKEKQERFRVAIEAAVVGRAEPRLLVSATSSDIAGTKLVEAMLDEILFVPGNLGDFARGLDVLPGAANGFLSLARDSANAILLDRDGTRFGVLVLLRAPLLGVPTVVMGRMRFHVRGTEDSPRAELAGGYELMKIREADLASTTIDREDAVGLLGVFRGLLEWRRLLA